MSASKPHSSRTDLQATGALDALRLFVETAAEHNLSDDHMARFSVGTIRDLFEQLEAYEQALTRIAGRGGGRKVHPGELTCVMIATSALDRDSYPANVLPDEGTPSHPGSEAVTTGVHTAVRVGGELPSPASRSGDD